MKKILLWMVYFSPLGLLAQQTVFSRSEVNTGDWGSGDLPWFYQSSNNSQGDPDNNGSTRNFIRIGHNNNTTMTTNGRFYICNTLDFESAATAPRTINNNGGGLSVSGGIYNASSANHTFNTPIGVDGTLVQIHANSTGGLTFSNTIFVNNFTLQFGNSGVGAILVSGSIQGAGQVGKVGNNILTLSGQNTYTGLTTISGGILRLNRVGGATLPATNNIDVNTSATLRISSDQTLNTVTLNGGTILIDSGVVLTVTNLITNSGTVSGLGDLKILDLLTVNTGTFTTNDKITLVSTAIKTARVAPVSGTVSGQVIVERFIQGRRAFRFLTPGVTTTSSIRNNWQNSGLTTAGIGTQITGSTSGANGFDQTTTGNPSLHTYDAQITGTTTGFVAATNTDVATLKAGVGYRLLVRGDRNVVLTNPSTDNMNVPTTLSAKGTLTTGTVTFDSSAGSPAPTNNQAGNTQTNGYTLVGNPYASPVDWDAVTKTGVAANAYYTWDPTLGTTAQRGRYVVYSPTLGTNLYDDNSPLSQTNRRYLQTGQAVFIKNTDLAIPATLTFNEANKASVNSFVFRTNQAVVTATGNSSLYLSVYDSNELAIGEAPIDGTVALFGSAFNNALDANDVDKLTTSGENLAFVRENKNLAIETVAPVVANDALFVKTVQFQAGKNYTFKVNTVNFNTAVTAKMVDLYLNTETAIDLTQPSFVTFATTADANSYGSDRFKIVFNSAVLTSEIFNANSVSIYPNPIANNEFTIALPNSVIGNVTVKMSNMLGQEVYNRTAEATTTMQIQPKQQLQEGVYVVSISNNGQVILAKVIVKK